LRAVVSQLPDREVQLVLRGSALVQYHAHHRYCPQCGQLTHVDMLGSARFCESCSTQQFPRTDPAIIVAVTDDQDRIVLGHHQGWMENRYALFAGFVEAGESLEQAVIREVAEEVSLSLTDIEYAGSQPWPLPRSLMIGFTAKAQAGEIAVDGEEIEDARWFSREDLRAAVQSKEITVPPAGSIGHRLIFAWYGQPTFD
ncbi:MAG: NAD(+) diphosphatase, partial [Propionibacteriaceae bacterium]|nr:NAD(+) diphosphatase [Propionibacteriaceae bacterium]